MASKTKIALLIAGAAAAYGIYKFYSLPEEEREELVSAIKQKTRNLIDDAGNTVEKVEHYVAEINRKGKEQWLDKLMVVKKMLSDLYITDGNLISRTER